MHYACLAALRSPCDLKEAVVALEDNRNAAPVLAAWQVRYGAKQLVVQRIEWVDSFRNQSSRACKCNFPLVQEARLNGRTMKNS